ncbi:hypothetical protein ACFYX8_11205 [Streptomyces cyaneofuscatus]|nr:MULTISPECIES: hypothetical protein [Streptomyces]WRO08657.1 hypothetical protein SJX93_03135 [Streptomyces cyaneofuscatus]
MAGAERAVEAAEQARRCRVGASAAREAGTRMVFARPAADHDHL